MNLYIKIIKNFSFTYPCPRNLREIVKMSLIEREPKHKVSSIWDNYHKDRTESISDTLSKNDYETLNKLSTESPMFLIPIKRKSGFFILLGQNQKKSFLYTYLEDYKQKGVHAIPYLIITLFDELLFKKEMVLVRGDILDIKLMKKEAQDIWSHSKDLYLKPDLHNEFVLNFNHRSDKFDFDKFKKHFDLI